jgi:hypothetical protein
MWLGDKPIARSPEEASKTGWYMREGERESVAGNDLD